MAEPVGFFTDVTVCIGCKACQVACHQWNDLPAWTADQPKDGRKVSLPVLSGDSYDNTRSLSDVNWRHVKFIEQFSPDPQRADAAWIMMSDVCKHCVHAPCLEVCPTGAIVRTEFDTVYIQEPACNGCRDCVAACPYGVIHMSETRHVAQKCTLLLRPAQGRPAARLCPGLPDEVDPVRPAGGVEETGPPAARPAPPRRGVGRPAVRGRRRGARRAERLLPAPRRPETYGLPSNPKVPSRTSRRSTFWAVLTGALAVAGGAVQVPRAPAGPQAAGRAGGEGGGVNLFVADPDWGSGSSSTSSSAGSPPGRTSSPPSSNGSALRMTPGRPASLTGSRSRWSPCACCSW